MLLVVELSHLLFVVEKLALELIPLVTIEFSEDVPFFLTLLWLRVLNQSCVLERKSQHFLLV